MSMKKTVYLVGVAILLIAIVGLFGCSKKDATAKQGAGVETLPTQEAEAKEEITGSKSQKEYFKEAEKAFKRAKVAPASDFVYGLADSGDGVVIKKYQEKEIFAEIIIPAEIEGLPVVELAERAFSGSSVKTVVVPDSITRFTNFLFSEAQSLKYVKLPSSMTSIPYSCFSGCKSLEYFEIPPHITNIEASAFWGSGLRKIEIPSTVTSFQTPSIDKTGEYNDSSNLFTLCKNLEYVKLPNTMKVIGSGTFSLCDNLKQVVLPETLEIIEERAFDSCRNLEQIDIPETVVSIGYNALRKTGLTSLVIPESVADCADLQLGTCDNLESLTLPNSVTHIKKSLLYTENSRTKKLKSVNLPAFLQKIDDGAFYGLSSLEELIIPENLISIEFSQNIRIEEKNNAFYGTSLPLSIQAKLKQLGYPGEFN